MTRLMPLITLFALTTAVLALSLLWRLLAAKSGELSHSSDLPEDRDKYQSDDLDNRLKETQRYIDSQRRLNHVHAQPK